MEIKFLVICIEKQLRKIPFSDISYIEAAKSGINIFLQNGKEVNAKIKMGCLLGNLPSLDFKRVNETFVVAVESIDAIMNGKVIINKKEFFLTSVYENEVIRAFRNKVRMQFLAYMQALELEKFSRLNAV